MSNGHLFAVIYTSVVFVVAVWWHCLRRNRAERPQIGSPAGQMLLDSIRDPRATNAPLAPVFEDTRLTPRDTQERREWDGPVLPPSDSGLCGLARREATSWPEWHDYRRVVQGGDDDAGQPRRAGE